ncbi:DUF6270 domain-containing protein [Brevibacterium sp. UBA7493]|uniref:DUF6270 domain-containing protein n=1 Tax=Brevibacterium sp. UBA7493 TaxID=1946121 RepID=UPI002580A5CE|nr:DUF6270 domain-containing protein [Brevibacterium sp. UBA7493]
MTDIRIAIFGSCVSRDTCEYLPTSDVVCYVARQSAISSLHPVGSERYSTADLQSAFQAKMFAGDMVADVTARIAAAEPEVILVDLVDERRGVWLFPDGAYLTNSVEASRIGIEQLAPADGARLLPFGTDEHFDLWKEGFSQVMNGLRNRLAVCVFIDIDWAEAPEGAPGRRGVRSRLGSTVRRLQRGLREMRRTVHRGEGLRAAARCLLHPPATKVEALADQAREANRGFRRYRDFAARFFLPDHIVRRSAADVQMGSQHRWGQAPYHYRNTDYESIAAQVLRLTHRGDT